MTLLDRFRTQPQRHPDPAVRLAHLGEIPLTERELIAAIARDDDDARVRRAAVAKLMDPVALGAICRDDRDESVRGQAAEMLRDIALEAFEGIAEADGLEAVDALTDVRALSQIAKTGTREIVALRALSRISDVRLLGSIARHAASEAARRAALERVRGDNAEVIAVAMNSEFKDTALAAVDLVTDSAQLEQIATRARNKSSAKRARAILKAAEDRTQAEQAAAAEGAAEASAANEHGRGGRLQPDLPPNDEIRLKADLAPEEIAATEAAAREAAERARTEEDARRRKEQREQEAAAERTRAQVAAEEEARRVSERRHVRLAELLAMAGAAVADPDLASARRQLGLTRREWKDLVTGITVDETLAGKYAEAESAIAAREAEARDADARARREALARLQHLMGRVDALIARPDLSLKAADRALRDVRTALGAVPPLPSKQDYDEIVRRLKAAQTVITPKVQDLRETEEWQRWANVGIQEQLCMKMEALKSLEDPEAIARQVRELQQQWRMAADVPRLQADALWRRFKAAHDEVWARCEAHFAAQAQERATNLARKTALCEKAESLSESTSWIQTAEEIKKLQAEWKTIGPVSRGREKAIWDRFRAACDRFFTRRHDDLARLKKLWAENFAKKEALCAKAEALAESSDWEPAAADIKRLQIEWKSIGPVKKSRSDAIWQRFRAASDKFFARYAQRHDIARAERVAAREAICAELESLSAGEGSEAPPNLLERIRAIRGRWQQELVARGVDPDRARAFDERFAAAFASVNARWPAVIAGTDLDPDANRKRMEAIVRKIEDLATALAGPSTDAADSAALSPANRLAAMLKEALAANTIGGKVEDDGKWRAAMEDVRQAQNAFSRVGHVPEEARRQLADRFQRAMRRISERAAGRASAAPMTAGPGRSGRPGGVR